MAQAPDQTTGSRARRTPFSDMAEQLYPEQGQTDPATEDVQNGEDFDGGAPNDTSGDAGNSGESPVHPAGHGLGQALEDALFWNAKGQPDAQGSSPASSAPAPAGESQPGDGGAQGKQDSSSRDLLNVLLRLGGLNTAPKASGLEKVRLAGIHEGLDRELTTARESNGGPLSPKAQQDRTLGYAARILKQYGSHGNAQDGETGADAGVRTPTREEWNRIVDVAGPIPKLVRDGKLLWGHDDKKYEELTGIKNGISEFQRKLGVKVTGKFDKGTYATARQAFVAMILPWAERAEKESGVPVQVSVGQALLESTFGLETPTDVNNKIRSHNLYGIKARDGDSHVTAPTLEQNKKTKEYRRVLGAFKSYDDYEQSVMDHARFLRDGTSTFRANYPDYNAMVRSSDLKLWAKGLKQAGYATELDYENRLLKQMELSDKIIGEIKNRGK